MITQVAIENFKSLKKVEVHTQALNLLMGLNGMGKTSFIQALLLLMQSDKLEDQVLDLNGTLVRIGIGKDALYQFAESEHIVFELCFPPDSVFRWNFLYQRDREKLLSENQIAADQMALFRSQTQLFQYISAERIGPRDIYEASSIVVADKKQLGLLGEFAAYFINVFGQEYTVAQGLRHPQATAPNLIAQINAWMQEISPGVTINTRYLPEINKVILDYVFKHDQHKTNAFLPKNVGFGISYVLPVVLALLTARENKIIVIENPESHIHPRGQAELGKLIALAAHTGAQLFVETHSDHILNGIRVAVKQSFIDRSQVNVLYFDKVNNEREQYTRITPIKVGQQGELSEYPKNFLDEWSNQLFKLM
ncbi:MAG: DUF3696 domain-containing protein [Bacteroides sp.]|nr:DUF3696 domain-containing protein [Bacteroides sp.]